MSESKRMRFEIFKRDGFRCQYCGRTPPEVILELDHIIARANGGTDDISNYITACFDCNRGKGAVPLDSIPQSLLDKKAEIEERREQVKAYTEFLEQTESEINEAIDKVTQIYEKFFPDWTLSDIFKVGTVKHFLRLLPTIKVCEAMETACSKFYFNDNRCLKYFAGICWNWIKRPETRDW